MKTKQSLFGQLNFYSTALKIALPVMLEMFVQFMVSLIDNFMVAGLGDIKMSGVNLVNHLVYIILIFFTALAGAGGMFMSQYNGAKDKEGMQNVFRFKQISFFVSALIFMLVLWLVPRPLLTLLVEGNASATAILDQGEIYAYLIMFTFIPMGLSMGIASSLREIGIVKAPMIISSIGTLINTFFNYVLIYGKWGFPRLEVAGAAYATIIARVSGLIIFLVYIRIKKPDFFVSAIHIFKVKLSFFGKVLKKSSLVFVCDLIWVFCETVSMALYNKRGGADVVAGMSAGWTLTNLAFLIEPAISVTIGVIVGGSLGKNDFDRARKEARWLNSGAVVMGFFGSIVTLLCILIIPIAFGRLSLSAQLIARKLLIMASIYMPIWTYINTQFFISRAGGDVVTGLWIDLIGNVGLFIPAMYLLTYLTDLDAVMLYGLGQVPSLIRIPIARWQLKKERWVKNLTNKAST